jgi:alcohol dehydrogenase class IV
MMSQFAFFLPGTLHCGSDCLDQLCDVVSAFGNRIVVLCDSPIRPHSVYQRLKQQFTAKGFSAIFLEDVDNINNLEGQRTLLAKIRVARPHAMVVWGGLRTLSLSRSLATLGNNQISLEHFLGASPVDSPAVPLITVAASLRDPYCGNSKYLVADGYIGRPVYVDQGRNPVKASFFDPQLHVTLPLKQAALCLFEQLLFCTDLMVSKHGNSLSSLHAKEAASASFHCLRSIASDGMTLSNSSNAATAGSLAALASASCPPGFGQGLVAGLHSRIRQSRALIASIVLPQVIELYSECCPELFVDLALASGADIDTSQPVTAPLELAKALRRLSTKLNLPQRLQDLRVNADHLSEAANRAMGLPFVNSAPFSVNTGSFADVLRKSL